MHNYIWCIYTYTTDLRVWGCRLRLGRLMKANLCWSDSSLLSQADHPGGHFRHLYGECWVLVLLVLSLRAIICQVRLVVGWHWAPSEHLPFEKPSSLRHQDRADTPLPGLQSWPMKAPCFAGQSNWFRDGPMTPWGLKSHNNFSVTFENEVFMVSNWLKPSEKEVWSLGQPPY